MERELRRPFWVLLLIATAGCGGSSAAPANAAPTNAVKSDPIAVVPSAVTVLPAEGCEQLNGLDATFALYVPSRNEWRACNAARAAQRFLPASTFKVANALIALETGVVRDPDAMVPWDGVERGIATWNQDTSLRTGMRNSTVWFYQGLARQVGPETMRRWVDMFDYGNTDIGPDHAISHFWLDGALRISAYEQITFLDRLRRRALPTSERSQAMVIEVIERERSREQPARDESKLWTLRGKTGAALPIDAETGALITPDSDDDALHGAEPVGWFVGWVEQETDGDAVFAFNMRMTSADQLPLREFLCKQLLVDNHVYFMATDE